MSATENIKTDWLARAAIAACGLLVIVGAWWGIRRTGVENKACEAAGGTMVRTDRGRVCAKLEEVRNVSYRKH